MSFDNLCIGTYLFKSAAEELRIICFLPAILCKIFIMTVSSIVKYESFYLYFIKML